MDFDREMLIGLLTLIPILLVAMMFHELAHGYVAYKLGDPTAKRAGRLSFNPIKHLDVVGTTMFFVTYILSQGSFLFGYAKPVPVSPFYFKNRQWGMALVAFVGPLTNFALAIVTIVALNAAHPDVDGLAFELAFLLFQVNIVLGLLNLVPIPPLDGSRILGAFLPRRAYERWMALDQYGMIIVIAFVVFLWGPFGRMVSSVINSLANLFLTNY